MIAANGVSSRFPAEVTTARCIMCMIGEKQHFRTPDLYIMTVAARLFCFVFFVHIQLNLVNLTHLVDLSVSVSLSLSCVWSNAQNQKSNQKCVAHLFLTHRHIYFNKVIKYLDIFKQQRQKISRMIIHHSPKKVSPPTGGSEIYRTNTATTALIIKEYSHAHKIKQQNLGDNVFKSCLHDPNTTQINNQTLNSTKDQCVDPVTTFLALIYNCTLYKTHQRSYWRADTHAALPKHGCKIPLTFAVLPWKDCFVGKSTIFPVHLCYI